MSRRLAREYSIQFLFNMDFNKTENTNELLEDFFDTVELSEDFETQGIMSRSDKSFSLDLIKGAISRMEEIDRIIESNTMGWKIDRIAKVDLAILRMSLYEILYRDDIPDSVSANEAIELAKKYSTAESGSFINGILGKVIKDRSEKHEQ